MAKFKGKSVRLNKPSRIRKVKQDMEEKFQVYVSSGNRVKRVFLVTLTCVLKNLPLREENHLEQDIDVQLQKIGQLQATGLVRCGNLFMYIKLQAQFYFICTFVLAYRRYKWQLAPIYCTHQELKRVFPQLDEFDTKTPIYGWIVSSGSLYVAHDSGLVTALFKDGSNLGSCSIIIRRCKCKW